MQVLSQDVLVACIMMGLTVLVGIVGNILMMRALIKYVHLRIDFFILLGSVAIGDMLSLIVSVPLHILHMTHGDNPAAWCIASK